jgi:hypothetical protein
MVVETSVWLGLIIDMHSSIKSDRIALHYTTGTVIRKRDGGRIVEWESKASRLPS